jgi:hypothetical protein
VDDLLDEGNLLTQIFRTACSVPSSGLCVESLSIVRSKPSGKWRKGIRNVVSDALSVSTAVIAVEILVHVEDQVGGAVVWVHDFEQCGARTV